MGMTDDEHWARVARYLAGESTPEEAAQVRRWLAEDPSHQRMLDTLQRAQAAVAIEPPANLDVEAALRRVHERMDAPVVRPLSGRPEPQPAFRWHPLAAAAAVAVLVAGGYLVRRQVVPVDARTYSAGSQPDSVVLPDGSGVLLSPGSSVTTVAGYGQTMGRVISLDGQALFDVRPGAPRFTVLTRSGPVTDISTRFSVRSDAGTPVTVVVTEGAVLVQGDTLRAGRRATVTGGRVIIDSAGEADLAWTRRRLVYHDAPLDVVRADLRRWYGIHLVIADTAFGHRRLTATFQGDPVPRVLDVIGLALGARIERRGDSAFVHAR